jgi:site-specific DNA-methyltransferase (adenine-specific)
MNVHMNLLNLDGNVIYNAPCLEEMASMPDKCIDHTITDPPYSHHVHTNQTRFTESNRLANGSNTYKYELGFSCLTSESRVEYALQFARLTKRWILVFCDAESIGDWKRALEYAGSIYKRTCAWIKPTAQPQLSGDRPAQGFEPIACAYGSPGRSVWNAGGKVGLYHSLVPRSEERFHPTEKPVDLMEQIIKDFTSPNDLILDPFSGSGSTHVAAKKWMRKSIGFEVDESYSSKANARITKTECVLDDPSSFIQKNHLRQVVMGF